MEKFKELSYYEEILVNGGMDTVSRVSNEINSTWWAKGLNAIGDGIDFVSGFADGFVQGFKETI